MAGGKPKRHKADCRADTRGGPWAGIPKVLIDSVAYRHLSVHARAVLVELVSRMNGYNNGQIGMSHREMVDGLRCAPRAIVGAIAELVEHGIVDVTVEGTWKTRQARQYRLTFVNTKSAPASNEYLRWTPTAKKTGATAVVAEAALSASDVVAVGQKAASDVVAGHVTDPRISANPEYRAASTVVALISRPYPAAVAGVIRDTATASFTPPNAADHRSAIETERRCERCANVIMGNGRGQCMKRFCSETCRKASERDRARQRRTDESDPHRSDTVVRMLNGGRQSVARHA